MSGEGVPSRTTTPSPTRPRSMRLPGAIRPLFSISAISGAATILSSAAPAGEAAIMAISNAVARSAVMRSSVADVAGQHAGTDADLLHRPVVFRADVGAENQLGVCAAMQPAIVLQLALELARRPAGIAERQDRACRAGAPGDRFENIECGGEGGPPPARPRRRLH